MGKIRFAMALAVAALSLSAAPAFACTSFAVYSDNNLYGMNFDYPETELKFSLRNNNGLNEFYIAFLESENYYTVSGINEKGLLIAMQNQFPALPLKDRLEGNEIYIGQLMDSVGQYGTVDEVRKFLKDKRLAPMQIPIHILAADSGGDSVIIEAGEERNDLIISDRKFTVMTNFRNSDFIGRTYDEVTGAGADRYQTAYKMIQDNFQTFDTDRAWDVLKSTAQESGGCQTLCSTVYDPSSGTIYLALERNFDRIWKISLAEGTISTYKGFDTDYAIRMNGGEITASELASLKVSADGPVELSNIGVLSHPAVEAKAGAEAGEKGNSLVFSLVLITVVLAGLSIVPALMISRAMRGKKNK